MVRFRNFQQPVPLTNEKMIVLEYPRGNMKQEDFAALKAFIAFLEISEGIAGQAEQEVITQQLRSMDDKMKSA